jgi:hypothetical protein
MQVAFTSRNSPGSKSGFPHFPLDRHRAVYANEPHSERDMSENHFQDFQVQRVKG